MRTSLIVFSSQFDNTKYAPLKSQHRPFLFNKFTFSAMISVVSFITPILVHITVALIF
jgi:hypothetical protein